ncbi:Na(+) H(+) antiporter subunit D [Devosia sp. LC5]|uniref:monovalent cation/H+ antiporter subunit D n=1 Tax=Devosia sp. LC5 TaxID=1502724 RepID=UPI0004E333F8|nr:monovalent cation/H+ antiporter subunit D [Devosia sp. LC5]KFC70648.1 Na(+) H(+) antiporter subunit D [Devosia sp. LC5]
MHMLLDHLVILPILLPLATGAILLFINDRLRPVKAAINFASTMLLLVLAILLVRHAAETGQAAGGAGNATYPLGNWPVPFGIVLVADRLSALLVLLAAILGLCALTFSLARWHAVGPSFHSLFQFLLMGLCGAFLTGDLFNLFVFFEVLLAASYGLALHGSGSARVRAGLHYIAINLAASSLFLIGAALIYGVIGTLNMADIAARVAQVAGADRGLLEAGAGILGIAFLVKAGMWPLGFWLPNTYAAASAPVAALFAIMTKVGIYAVLRLSLLVFGDQAGASAGFGQAFLLYGGMATIAYGAIGALAAQSTARLSGNLVLMSSGTLLAAIGFGNAGVVSGALFYLVSSTLAISALFLLVELLERIRVEGADILAVTLEAYGDDDEEDEVQEVGVVIPGALAVLGVSFAICALVLSGLPPLSGFLAKFAMISPMLNPEGLATVNEVSASAWWLAGLLIFSGFAALIALSRTGINTFWATVSEGPAAVRVIEILPVIVLLGLCVIMVVLAGPIMTYLEAAANALHAPAGYIADVLGAPVVVDLGGAP